MRYISVEELAPRKAHGLHLSKDTSELLEALRVLETLKIALHHE